MSDCDCDVSDCGDCCDDGDCECCCGDDGCGGNDGDCCYDPFCSYHNEIHCSVVNNDRSETSYEYKEVNYSDHGLQDIATLTAEQILLNLQQDLITYIAVREALNSGTGGTNSFDQARNKQNVNVVNDFPVSEKKKVLFGDKENEIQAHTEDETNEMADFRSVDEQKVDLLCNNASKTQENNAHHVVNTQPTTTYNKSNTIPTARLFFTAENVSNTELNLVLLGVYWEKQRKMFLEKAATLTPEQRKPEEIAVKSEIERIQEELKKYKGPILIMKSHKRKTRSAIVLKVMALLAVFMAVIVLLIIFVK